MAVLGSRTLSWSGRTVMGRRLVKKWQKAFFQNRVARGTGRVTCATVNFSQLVWTVEKPKVSTLKISMAVLGRLTPAWSSRTVMGRRLVKK